MKRFRKLARAAACAAVVFGSFAVATPARAAFINGMVSVDFNGTNAASVTASGAAVVGSAGDAWNGFATVSQSTPVALKLVDGVTDSEARLTWSADSSFRRGAVTNPKTDLLTDYLVATNGNTRTATITGLDPAVSYDLYVYAGIDANLAGGTGRTHNFTVTGATAASGSIVGDGSKATWIEGTNYRAFTLTPDATGQLAIAFKGNPANEGDLAGFQIRATPAPEPASLGLLGLGGFAWLARRQRRA